MIRSLLLDRDVMNALDEMYILPSRIPLSDQINIIGIPEDVSKTRDTQP